MLAPMHASLRATLESLARGFASRLIRALVYSDDTGKLAAFVTSHRTSPAKRSRRRVRKPGTYNKVHVLPNSVGFEGIGTNRGHAAIMADAERIVAFLVEAGRPVKSKHIRAALGLTKDRFLRTAHRAVAAGQIEPLGHMAMGGYVAVSGDGRRLT